MKKKVAVLFCVLFTVLVMLIACGEVHTHEFKEYRTEATCTENGVEVYRCDCGQETNERELVAKGHKEAEAVIENNKDAACTVDGSYDVVVYCEVCEGELSRVTELNEALGHVLGETKEENFVEPACTVDGSYDLVTYCTVCDEVAKRETIPVESQGHVDSDPIAENFVEASCTVDGSCDMVTYCIICSDELKRELTAIKAEGHKSGAPKEENRKNATCTADGSYDLVVYCTVCNEEISREAKEISSQGHKNGTPYEENFVEVSCENNGSYDIVIKCTVCFSEISRETKTIISQGHQKGESYEENRKEASCTVDGSYDMVTKCTVCFEEISRETIAILASHNYVDGTCTKCGDEFPYTKDGNKIYFGTYPQAAVTDATLKSSLNTLSGGKPTTTDANGWTSYGYYINGSQTDFMWYMDVENDGEKYRGVYYMTYRPVDGSLSGVANSYQDENRYYQGTVHWFKYEPISWTILQESGGRALILCDLILDAQAYDYEGSSVTVKNNYADSTVRAWLNDTFYETAFSEAQKALIATMNVDNSAISTGYTSNPNAGAITKDKITLLSYKELSTYLTTAEARQKQNSDYANCQGAFSFAGNDMGAWLLRSPERSGTTQVRIVGEDGGITTNTYASYSFMGIVPALYITIE